MYQTLVNIRFEHEFYNGTRAFNMAVHLSQSSQKLVKNMDLVIQEKNGSCVLLWNSEKYSKDELIEDFNDQYLTLYLQPENEQLFYNVTKNLKNIHYYGEHTIDVDGEEKKTIKNTPCTNVFYITGKDNAVKNTPIEKLKRCASIGDIKNINSIDLDKPKKEIKCDDGVKEIHKDSRYKNLIAILPISILASESELGSIVLKFDSEDRYYKYFIADQNMDKNIHIEKIRIDTDEYFKESTEEVEEGKMVRTFTSPVPIKLQDVPNFSVVCVDVSGKESDLPHPKVNKIYSLSVQEKQNLVIDSKAPNVTTAIELFINQ